MALNDLFTPKLACIPNIFVVCIQKLTKKHWCGLFHLKFIIVPCSLKKGFENQSKVLKQEGYKQQAWNKRQVWKQPWKKCHFPIHLKTTLFVSLLSNKNWDINANIWFFYYFKCAVEWFFYSNIFDFKSVCGESLPARQIS